MQFRASEIAAIVGGELHGPDVVVDGAGHDSRDVAPGALFVPVVAERDGHDFIAIALQRGAAATFSARSVRELELAVAGFEGVDVPTVIWVPDTEAALTAWGSAARHRLGDVVVGITGSVGKTTTKDLAAAALGGRFRTHASLRSFNNEIGVPLTLLGAPDGTEATVVEMGARGKGHIAILCQVARPTIAVVTAVEEVHTELFGSIREVASAKAELVEALPAHGTAILNAANPLVLGMAERTVADVVTFGAPDADVVAEHVELDHDLRARFTLRSPWGSAQLLVPVRGAHNVGNALAAITVAVVAGASLEEAVEGLASASMSPWRMELVRSTSGARILNDAYNAGPASMHAALDALAALPAGSDGRRVAVLGVMAELGEGSAAAHRSVAAHAADLGVEVIAVAAPELVGPTVSHVPDLDAALQRLGPLTEADAVLVKGSRVAGLERLVPALVGAGR